ncbi:phosphotransferase family protein [Frankia sp. AiPs1]|uniref:phosphotransferase family protein n=1 Tax=Frankia sp. AiPs1 TaxID=573493 RepID=UPI0020432789|nr:phosphotransferase family protein [Frankia sp. AiPs1]MCM3922225.1 phosphotransferase family protein [Frankia sp. AiPs1]
MTALDPPHGAEEGLVAPPGLDLAALSAYLDAAVPGRSGPLRAALLSGGRSNLTYHVWDDAAHWALRRPPLGNLTPSAHDMRREYRVVAALHDTAIPVADAVVYCDDPAVLGVPFALVSLVDGVVLRSRADLAPYSDADVRRCAENLLRTLARLHAVDHRAVGLERFGRPEGYLRRQVDRWWGQWERVRTRPLPDLDALHSRLDTAVPAESDASIVHGDARIDNFVLDPADIGAVRALLDWEMATLGDPLADLGLTVVYRDPDFDPVLGGSAAAASDRMPGGDEMIEIYARESGRDIVNMDFYLALGYFKLVVIAEGIHARHLAGNTVGEGFDLVGQAVPALAAGGLRALAG